uniref:Uncharacterized protein n=1 Tax=Oryza brachyantha TaxID=4533 RepID=J3LNX6_ORYBR
MRRRASRRARGRPTVSSLSEVEELIDSRGRRRGLRVKVPFLSRMSEAPEMQRLLRQRVRRKGWRIDGLEHLDPLVGIHPILALADAVLDHVIADYTGAPASASVPWPDVLQLARMARAVAPRRRRRRRRARAPTSIALLRDAGGALSDVRLGSIALEDVLRQLGELLEEIGCRISTERCRRPGMVELLRGDQRLTQTLLNLKIPASEFNLL